MQPATCEFQELVPEPVSAPPAAVPTSAPSATHAPGTPGHVPALQRSAGERRGGEAPAPRDLDADGFLAVEESGATQFVREADLPLL